MIYEISLDLRNESKLEICAKKHRKPYRRFVLSKRDAVDVLQDLSQDVSQFVRFDVNIEYWIRSVFV